MFNSRFFHKSHGHLWPRHQLPRFPWPKQPKRRRQRRRRRSRAPRSSTNDWWGSHGGSTLEFMGVFHGFLEAPEVSWNGCTPRAGWFHPKSSSKIDDDWGYPYRRNPPFRPRVFGCLDLGIELADPKSSLATGPETTWKMGWTNSCHHCWWLNPLPIKIDT